MGVADKFKDLVVGDVELYAVALAHALFRASPAPDYAAIVPARTEGVGYIERELAGGGRTPPRAYFTRANASAIDRTRAWIRALPAGGERLAAAGDLVAAADAVSNHHVGVVLLPEDDAPDRP